MLRSVKDMEDYSIEAPDGIVGRVRDLYFDDESWVIRYLVVETGEWLSKRRVLISPIAIREANWPEKRLFVSITQAQVKNSPNIDTHKPVSRQHEIGYLGYYGYPYYWGGGGLWGAGLYPGMMLSSAGYGGATPEHRQVQAQMVPIDAEMGAKQRRSDDPHLRSGNEVMRYYVHATDGDIGHIQNLIVDEKTWAIRYLIVNTSNWWLGHEVLIAPQWIDDINWAESTVTVGLTRQAVRHSPTYDATIPLDREQETELHGHYGRHGYWQNEANTKVE
jgi:sporulation protein YlmC with PRC-barrel domain